MFGPILSCLALCLHLHSFYVLIYLQLTIRNPIASDTANVYSFSPPTQDGRSGLRVRMEPAGKHPFPASFRSVHPGSHRFPKKSYRKMEAVFQTGKPRTRNQSLPDKTGRSVPATTVRHEEPQIHDSTSNRSYPNGSDRKNRSETVGHRSIGLFQHIPSQSEYFQRIMTESRHQIPFNPNGHIRPRPHGSDQFPSHPRESDKKIQNSNILYQSTNMLTH